MRLIDADAEKVMREKIIDLLYAENVRSDCGIERLADEICATDAVEVVRCRGCKWYEIRHLKADGTDDRRYKPDLCVLHNRNFPDNYFCADGERREDDS